MSERPDRVPADLARRGRTESGHHTKGGMVMYRKIREVDKCVEVSSEPRGTIAVVVRMYLKDMPELVRFIEDVPGARLVYQRTSAGKLRIIEGE